jgi:CxxC-x17-CxxC domain-containing protein
MEVPSKTVYFAQTNFRGNFRTFGIRTNDRRQHTYVIGKTGVGKTNLLKSMALQDIANGDGIAIIDPHGSFVEEVLAQIPERRMQDVIYINPIDMDNPVGFNVLEVPDQKYKHLVASDLMGIFTKIWANVWSARMEYILNNCVLALLDTPGSTLLGIPRILVDKDFRSKIIENVKDPVVRSFWVQEFESWREQFRNEAIVPIQNKVGQFLSTAMIRNIVGQEKSSFNVFDIMNQRKILLVNVAKGRVGEDNAKLLGAMLITKIQLAAMERVRIPENERKDFYLYVDEFQNFATQSFASILSEARKYRLNILLAHQYVGQLVSDNSTEVRDAVFGNVGTMIVFRVGAADAEFLENEFLPEFQIQDLVNLPNYNIYIKLMVNGVTSRPFSALTIPAKSIGGEGDSTEIIIANSRKYYSRSRKEVEDEIDRWSGLSGVEGPSAEQRSQKDDKSSTGERYTVNCSVCGKPAHLNFKPDDRRPIYCSDCLKKVQSGEITPPVIVSKPSYDDSLSVLGIDVGGGVVRVAPRARPQSAHSAQPSKPQPPKSQPSIRVGAYVTKPVGEKPMSLKDLPKPQHQKRGPDMVGLKDALKNALSKKDAPKDNQSSHELKPGEAVKL